MEKTNTEKGIELSLENFQDEAWMIMRFNEWEPDIEDGVQGATMEKLSGDLYLLKAEKDHVSIRKKVKS